jgi:hypothetical protein
MDRAWKSLSLFILIILLAGSFLGCLGGVTEDENGIIESPDLVSPPDSEIIDVANPYFEWTSVTDADDYEIMIDDGPSFASPIVNETVSTWFYQCEYSLADGTYHWKVRASDGDARSNWSSAWSFTISSEGGDEIVQPPTPLSPSENSELTNPIPPFEWMGVPDADDYEIMIGDSPSFTSPLVNTTVTTNYFIYSETLPYGTYYWAVRAREGDVWSNWSSYWSFTIIPQVKSGALTQNETWSGEIYIDSPLIVPQNITLTIEPGTIIRVEPCRDYRDPAGKVGIFITGGTLNAIGNPDGQIFFTSNSTDPINGDWSGIWFYNCASSIMDYVVVEYSLMGIGQFDSSVNISHSIVRWVNWEGIYAERSTFSVENCTLYSNGYHEIALEQYNEDIVIKNNIFRDGNFALHSEKTEVHIEGNYFHNYRHIAITAGHQSNLTVINNKFENITEEEITVNPDCNLVSSGNDMGNGSVPIPEMDYPVLEWYTLGYIPCDPEDRYAYVFEPEDETRGVVKRIGEGLSFGWTLLYADSYLWRFTFGDGAHDFVKVDPDDGTYQKFNSTMMNPRGLAWDGANFWVNDFSLLKIFKFTINETSVIILDSFDIPEKEKGGCMGLTYDGTFLYLIKRDGSGVYKIDTNGTLVGTIDFYGGIHHAIVWTGEYFWAVGGGRGIGMFTPDGNLVGSIFEVAEGTWAVAWDGTHLWTLQRTCELWNDAKIFEIEVLDFDS